MIRWPDDLIEDIARRRCVIFLGAGISASCENNEGRRPHTWKEFLQHAKDAIEGPTIHIQKLIKKQDYLTACEVIKKAVGYDRFKSLVTEEFLVPKYKHSRIHEAIFKLDSRIVATPNFDKVYETYANGQAHSSIRIIHHYDEDAAEAVRRDHRLILKVHGTIDTPQKMIFTRKEYAEARYRYEGFYSVLGALTLTNTFLFLGCGVSDPDIRLLLEDNYFRHPAGRPHVMVFPKKNEHKAILDIIEETMNVKILLYNKANEHQELLVSVEALATMVDEKREQLKATSNW